jgi:exonuclease SbcC
MKTINLKSLTLLNFKGVTEKTINFEGVTNIHGANGTGKTSIFDAYTWLLYGKNSSDQTDFNIKTLDESGHVIHNLDHDVEGVFIISEDKTETTLTLKRCYSEKWTKKRGSESEELTGHETKFFIDGVPSSLSEYKTKVSLLIDESISKIISNPLYFNSKMKWNERREILEKMAGDITLNDIVLNTPNGETIFSSVIQLLNDKKNLEDEKKVLAAQRKKLKDEIETIPTRISEAQLSKGEVLDFDSLELELKANAESIKEIENKIENSIESIKAQQKDIEAAQIEKYNLLNEITKEQEAQSQTQRERRDFLICDLNELKDRSSKQTREQTDKLRNIGAKQNQIEGFELENKNLRASWNEWNEKTFEIKEGQNVCPACSQEIKGQAAILETSFNELKAERLTTISKAGKHNSEEIKRLTLEIETLSNTAPQSIDIYTETITAIELELNKPFEIVLTDKIKELQSKHDLIVIPEIFTPDNSELKAKKEGLILVNDEIKKQLFQKDEIDRIEKRVNELKLNQKLLFQELADVEKLEMQIDNFNKSKINLIESRINNKFSLVTFKMFIEQINGGEVPACECLVNGVPFNDLNTASKINAGLDIINGLQYHFEMFTPVFIDGRESVTNLIKTECQIISLIVDPAEKKLIVIN